MNNNARVDIVGRNHEGKEIYKVTIDGHPKELYLVDSYSDTAPKEPALEGNLACGLSVYWINWYRSINGSTFVEAREEGVQRLKAKRGITPP